MQTPTANAARAQATLAPAVAAARNGRRQRPVRGAALWATIGFVGGAVFWHAVGFWTFMSDLVFDSAEAVAASDVTSGVNDIVTGSLPTILHVDPANCISLKLDRLAGQTAAHPCPPEGLALRHDESGERGDLALLATDAAE